MNLATTQFVRRLLIPTLMLLLVREHLHASGLVTGQYRFEVPYSAVCLNGTYPATIGTMTSDCRLQAKIDASGNITGTMQLSALKGPISGTMRAPDGQPVLQLATSGQDLTQTASQIQGELHSKQFLGTATTQYGSVPVALDVSTAAPLAVSFDLDVIVDEQGAVSGTGTATGCSVTVPVQVTGTNAADNCALHIVGTDLPDFVWDGSGTPIYTGFAATYTATGFGVSNSGSGLLVTPKAAAPALLANISTRMTAQTGDNVLIGGFIITGTQPKKVIIRAIGPSLPVDDKLADPQLELHDSTGAIIASDDNWQDSANKQAIIDSTIPPSNDKESAIVAMLDAGAYTAIVRGANDTSGIALVEIFDLDTNSSSRLANISTRGVVLTGDDVMIGGFIVLGSEPQRVLVRAIGTSLPVENNLADPNLELHDPNGGLLAANDDWVAGDALAITGTQAAPTSNKESAIVTTLVPGAFTAIVRGNNGGTGVALVEVYGLNP